MATRRWQLGAFVASVWVSGVSNGNAGERMVGLVPTDGVAMFVKTFHVDAGTTITGVQFVNNDPAIVFPAVVLVVGAEGCLAGGTTVASAANVQEDSGSLVTVMWQAGARSLRCAGLGSRGAVPARIRPFAAHCPSCRGEVPRLWRSRMWVCARPLRSVPRRVPRRLQLQGALPLPVVPRQAPGPLE